MQSPPFRALGTSTTTAAQIDDTHLGADEVEVSAVRPEVDESLAGAQKPELIGISSSLGTVDLSDERTK